MTPEQQHALVDLAAITGDLDFCYDVGKSMTCGEAEAIANVLRAFGYADEAETFITGHAYGDEDETDSHHEMYLALQRDELSL